MKLSSVDFTSPNRSAEWLRGLLQLYFFLCGLPTVCVGLSRTLTFPEV